MGDQFGKMVAKAVSILEQTMRYRKIKADVYPDAGDTLNSAVSRPFEKPKGGRIAVKVINHLGDEVMKVFRV